MNHHLTKFIADVVTKTSAGVVSHLATDAAKHAASEFKSGRAQRTAGLNIESIREETRAKIMAWYEELNRAVVRTCWMFELTNSRDKVTHDQLMEGVRVLMADANEAYGSWEDVDDMMNDFQEIIDDMWNDWKSGTTTHRPESFPTYP